MQSAADGAAVEVVGDTHLGRKGEPLVYLGIIGFNQALYEKEFGILDKNTANDFKTFVSNLTRKDGTLLYYGVDKAIDMLKKQNLSIL